LSYQGLEEENLDQNSTGPPGWDLMQRASSSLITKKHKIPENHTPSLEPERRKRGLPGKTWMVGVRAVMKTRHLEADQWLNRKEWCLGSGRGRQLSQDRKDRYIELKAANSPAIGYLVISSTVIVRPL
jgi:hypothetical protein